jgi:thymidylate kinase
MTGKAKADVMNGGNQPKDVTRQEFMDFHNEILNRFQDITNSQVHMVDAQAETNENLNEVQSETKSKLDKITNLVTGLLVRDSDTPGY